MELLPGFENGTSVRRRRVSIALSACMAGWMAAGLSGCGTTESGSDRLPSKDLSGLRITEIHYHPADLDTIPGDEYEFIEIMNSGKEDLELTQVGFTQGIEFTFKAGDKIPAGGFLVLASNPARFEQRYGLEPFGAYGGKLNNAGESLTLSDLPADTAILSLSYADEAPWPARADGGGPSLVPVSPEAGEAGGGDWKTSFAIHGSPGKGDPVVVLINEVSTHTDPPASDAIELFNPNEVAMDIGGWFLTDDRTEIKKFRIPKGTAIPAGGYLVFDESDFNADSNSPTAFTLNSHGDEVFLVADSTGCGNGFCHGFAFGEIENGHTFGRYVNSWGEEHFVEQKSATLGAVNAGPMIGPVVISEVMYHPVNDSDEYLEIVNISDDSVALFDADFPENTWRIKGFGFVFPMGITLAPDEIILVLSASAPVDSFRAAHNIPDSTRIFTAGARLSNGGDTLSILQPKEPYEEGDGTVVPYRLVEQLGYLDSNPWPSEPDGLGRSLARKTLSAYGNDPGNWQSALPSPGK